jgi:predicted transposase/invertase (TIGR01784 family)
MKHLIRFDWAMKKLLRDKANYAVLEGFLSELFKFDITILQIGESEGNQQVFNDKFSRVDILAHTSAGEIVLVELQTDSELDYFHRMLYGVSKSIVENIKIGEQYGKIRKMYSVNIVYFQLGQGSDYVYHGKTEFRGLHTNDVLGLSTSQKERYKVENTFEIYPEFYILKINEFNDIAKDGLDEWIYFFKNNEVKEGFKAKGLDVVQQKLIVEGMSQEDRNAYNAFWENKRYESSMLDGALSEGMTKGKEEGRREATLKVAKNMLSLGMTLEQIASATGLTQEALKQL